MGKNTVKKLSNDLRKIASRKMKQITDLDQLEKQINEETINWTGKAREEKLGKEMSIAKIENEAEIKQMLRTFDRNLKKETQQILIENIKNITLLNETKALAKDLGISLSDTNELLTEQAKISEPALLITQTDPFSKLILRKMLASNRLTGDHKKKVRRRFTDDGKLEVLKQLETARNFIAKAEKKKPEEIKQIPFSNLLETELPVINS